MDDDENDTNTNVASATPLWQFVTKLSKTCNAGGNIAWRCNLCGKNYHGSYYRVRHHLLGIEAGGIARCSKITKKLRQNMERMVQEVTDKANNTKDNDVPLPSSGKNRVHPDTSQTFNSSFQVKGNDPKKRKGPIDTAFQLAKREEAKEEIARMFYAGGLSFNFAHNPHYKRAFQLVAELGVSGYVPPSYNILRTNLLERERLHIEDVARP